MSSNDKYKELGVTFKVLEPSDQPKIMEFLMESFFPDEPVFRSLKMLEGSGMVSNYISGLVRDELVDPCLLDGQSIAAIDKDGTVIGTRLGCIIKKGKKDPDLRWMGSMPSWCFPEKLIKLGQMMNFFESFRYGNKFAFEDIENVEKFYHGKSLTVGSKARGMGLGKELIKQTNKIALDKGCSHVYIAATSIYSQAIFKKTGFKILHQRPYDEFMDRDGKTPFFTDMREHKSCQVVLVDLKEFDFDQ